MGQRRNEQQCLIRAEESIILDENGTPFGIKQIDGKPRVSSMPYLYDIAEGNVVNHTPFAKYGRCIVQAASMDVWEGNSVYTFPNTAGERMRVVSSSVEDDTGGSGATKIDIEYLDASNDIHIEEVTLDGQTPVETVASMRRINRAWVSDGAAAVGTINIYHLTNASPIYGIIAATHTQTRQLIYTVPNGKNLFITSIAFSSGVGNTTASGKMNYVTFTTRATVDPETGTMSTLFYPYNEIGLTNGSFYRNLEMPTKIPEGADLKISVIGDTALAVACVAAIRGWTENN